MAPVDGQAMVQMGVPQPPAAGTIPLSTLIDYIIQRTYHELCVLSELLPRKTDMERKIEIVQFASRTRQLFVRLLALVKWANSAGKVDKCGMISSFLDQQAMYYVETADLLANMARVTLVRARLPSFCLPSAIDVLTSGTYPRLPTCIKEKIIPPDPITPQEKSETLMKLNQVIEHRVVTVKLPQMMRRLKIENGRVKFYVEHEFEVSLTVMGDSPNIPWRLLDIEILVEDPETGGGRALVHSLQVQYIHELVQSRLIDSDKPLDSLYDCLHSFCQSLQLEVLHSQAQQLFHQRLGDHIRIEEYNMGKSLVISYWRDPSTKKDGKHFPGSVYKISIHVDTAEPYKPLQVTHFPVIQGSESTKVVQAIRSDHLSLEKLLMHTIHVRSTAKLKELERELRCYTPGPLELKEVPSVLYCPVVHPCMGGEKLCVSVDALKGTFLTSIKEIETDLTMDIQDCLNEDHRDLGKLLSELRIWIGLNRIRRTVQDLSVACSDQIPITNMAEHPLKNLTKHRLYIAIPKLNNYKLVVAVLEGDNRSILYEHYVLEVQPITFEAVAGESNEGAPQVFYKALHLTQLDTYLCTHGVGSKLHDPEPEDTNLLRKKKKVPTATLR